MGVPLGMMMSILPKRATAASTRVVMESSCETSACTARARSAPMWETRALAEAASVR